MDLPLWGWIVLAMVLAGLLLMVTGVRVVRNHPASAEGRAFFAELMEGAEFRPWQERADVVCRELFADQDPQQLQRLFARHGFEFDQHHEFSHRASPELVDRFIEALFAEQGVAAVRAELARYHNDGPGVDDGRVFLDILYLSEGDFHSLPALVAEASRDFRDVVTRAEGPRSIRVLSSLMTQLGGEVTEELKAEIRSDMQQAARQDVREFVGWLQQTLPVEAEA